MGIGRPRLPIWEPIIADYVAGNTNTCQLAKKHGVSRMGIVKVLKREGLYNPNPVGPPVGTIPVNKNKSKYSLDVNAFDSLSPDARYWIGFLLADGCILDKRKGEIQKIVALELKAEDQCHVAKFKSFLSSTHPVYKCKKRNCLGYGNTGSYAIHIRSTVLADKLAPYNIAPRKTSLEIAPSYLEMDRDFWRGVVDGDGCISFSHSKHLTLSLVGSPELCKQFESFAKVITDTARTAKVKKNRLWYFSISGKDAAKMVNYLYSNASTALDRKAVLAAKADSLYPV